MKDSAGPLTRPGSRYILTIILVPMHARPHATLSRMRSGIQEKLNNNFNLPGLDLDLELEKFIINNTLTLF